MYSQKRTRTLLTSLPSNCWARVGFFWRDGLLYRLWTPPGSDEEMTTEQLVLPMQCRKAVLEVAHDIPLSGHLGKGKTAQRTLQRFYRPTLYWDVAEYCCTCEVCQTTSQCRPRRVPLSPMSVVEKPFGRITMDIIGPLPKSRLGKRYVLVICDYATRYPEAVALRSTEAEHIAEELVTVFASWCSPRNSDIKVAISRHDSSLNCTVCYMCIQFALPPTIRKQAALSSGLTKPSKRYYGRLHRPKARTWTNSFYSWKEGCLPLRSQTTVGFYHCAGRPFRRIPLLISSAG